MFTNCEDPEFNQVWLRQIQQICVCKKNWLNVSSLQQRSLDFDPTFKIERGGGDSTQLCIHWTDLPYPNTDE